MAACLTRARLTAVDNMGLQKLFDVVHAEFSWLDLRLNYDKSVSMRVGPRFDRACLAITTADGNVLKWVKSLRYLGICLVSSRRYKCCFESNKRKFSRAVNNILSKIGLSSSEDVMLELIKIKCMPILLYATKCQDINKRTLDSLNFCVIRFMMKIFKTSNRTLISDCLDYFGFALPSDLVARRVNQFTQKIKMCTNSLINRYT